MAFRVLIINDANPSELTKDTSSQAGHEVLFKTCVAMKSVDDDDDNERNTCSGNKFNAHQMTIFPKNMPKFK